MQSFISSNYTIDAYRISKNINNTSFIIEEITDAWIDKIFHKNDSYLRPIVINPFRGGGVIDLNNESTLSKDRLAAILIYAKQQESLPTNEKISLKYHFKDLEVSFNDNFLPQKLNKMYFDSKKILKTSEDVVCCVRTILHNINFKDSFKKLFNFEIEFGRNQVRNAACAYLLFKIYWISEKYAHYSNFKGIFAFNKDNLELIIVADKLIPDLLTQISNDFSHVTKKFWRTLNFLYSRSTTIKSFNRYGKNLYSFYDSRVKENPFAYTPFRHDNQHSKAQNQSFISPVDINFLLPPSIFDYELVMDKDGKKVKYHELSSGELQLLQTLSVHIYHIENLISIIEGNSKCCNKYTNINLVFDEVEICFHPRQQQKFIQYLLDWFNMLRIAKDIPPTPLSSKQIKPISLNIFILTHSPFILSDIPSSNIMYLNDGRIENQGKRQTYAANVNQLLFDSFFLGDGYTGDFAKNKITGLIYHISKDESCFNKPNDKIRIIENCKEWDDSNVNSFISDYIGDGLLKRSLQKLLDNENGVNK